MLVDSEERPVANASVIMLDAKGTTLTFTKSKGDGSYSVSTPENKVGKLLALVRMGYERDTLSLENFEQGQKTVLLEKAFEIKEVKVTAPQIRQRGDTLDYFVGMFKQKQDRTIEDVLKKMPGINVDKDGSIEVGGKKINKFYIEGMDLLGGKYAQATENLSADKVKKVQVLNNHQPVKMLRNTSFSDQAALNIVLADDAKEVWQGSVDVGTGSSFQKPVHWLGNARLTAMRFAHQSQSISMYKFNNTGKDILHEINIDQLLGLTAPDEAGVLRNINLVLTDLKAERTSFNNSHLLATNWLFKLGKDRELRFQLSGAFDKSKQEQTMTTLYTDVPGGAVIAEDIAAHSHESMLDADLRYQLNGEKTFFTNTLSAHIDWNRSTGESQLNGLTVRENVKPHKRSVTDDFRWIRKLRNNRNISLSGYLAYNDLPGRLLLNDGSWESLRLQSFKWKVGTWLSKRYGNVNVVYEMRTHGSSQWVNTENRIGTASDRYDENWLTGSAKIEYKKDWLNITARLPLSLLYRRLRSDKATNVLLTPDISMDVTPNNYWNFKLTYGYNWRPMPLTMTTGSSFFTNYISLTKGLGYLDNSHGHGVTTVINYRNISAGFFVTSITTWTNTIGNILYKADYRNGFYETTPTDRRSSGHLLMSTLRLSKSLHWCHLSTALQGGYTQNKYYLLLGDEAVPFSIDALSGTLSLSLQPAKWLSFDYNGTVGSSKQKKRDGSGQHSPSLVSFTHQLRVFILPGNWQIEWEHELYHGNNEAVSTNYFMDFSLSYRRKLYEIGVSLNNILNTKTYEQHYYTTGTQVHQYNNLRPREFMVNVSFDI